MFVRKKKNPSGVISIQIIDKNQKKYQVIKTIGSSQDPNEVSVLFNQGKKWIATHWVKATCLRFRHRKPKKSKRLII
jgi:hypothetical protein